jgi:PAS domain S-box-containing protein
MAVGFVAISLVAALAAYPMFRSTSGTFMMIGVILAVRFCGSGPAILATVLSVLCTDYFLTTPRFELGTTSNDTVWLTIFVLLSLTIILFGESVKRSASAARENELSFQATLSSIGDAVITTDTKGRILFMNPVAESLTRAKQENVRMLPLHKVVRLLDERTRAPQTIPLAQSLEKGADLVGNDYILVSPDRTERPVEASAAPMRDDRGRSQGAVIVFRDISARRQVERALRESSVFARVTLDALVANVCVLDEQGNIVAVNKSWRHFARENSLTMRDNGVGANYLAVCDAAAFEGSQDAAEFSAAIRNVLAGKQESFYREYSIFIGSEQLWFLGRVTRFPGQGTRRAVITHEDISSLKKAQRELQMLNETLEQRVAERTEEVVRAQEAVRRSERLAELGQMTAVLSHESRNALQRIQTAMDLLERRVKDNPEALRFIEETRRAQVDLRRVHEEVRGYAAPIVLEIAGHSLPEVWRQAWTSLEPQRRGRFTALLENFDADDTLCYVDAFRLQQVFRNLLENSLAACPDPVQIFVDCKPDWVEDQEAIRVSVRDNGPGLNAEQHERFFEPFYTTKPRGTGLGTAIVKRIVEAHGGRIWAEPPRGSGLEIVFMLPKGSPPASQPSTPPTSQF